MKHNGPQEGGQGAAYVSSDNPKYSTAASQRSIIYQELKKFKDGLTTFDIRSRYDIPHAAGRVQELRQRGHDIITVWDYDCMPGGDLHRVARYVMMPERQGRLFSDL